MVAVVPPGTLSAQSLADAIGRALAGPSLKSFPPCDVDGGAEDGGAIASPVGRDEHLGRSLGRGERAGARPAARPSLWWRDDDAADAASRARSAAGDPSRHRRAAGAGRRAGRRRRRRWPTGSPASRASTCCSMATPTSTTRRRRQQEDRAGPASAGDARAGRARHRPHGAGAAVRQRAPCRCWCRPGTASRRRWCRPCRKSAFAGLRPSVPRRRTHPVRGLLQVNTHVDLIDWKGGRGFVGEAAALAALGAALWPRARTGRRAGGRSQSSSCDGRRGVGFPKVDVGKSTENARTSHPAGP